MPNKDGSISIRKRDEPVVMMLGCICGAYTDISARQIWQPNDPRKPEGLVKKWNDNRKEFGLNPVPSEIL